MFWHSFWQSILAFGFVSWHSVWHELRWRGPQHPEMAIWSLDPNVQGKEGIPSPRCGTVHLILMAAWMIRKRMKTGPWSDLVQCIVSSWRTSQQCQVFAPTTRPPWSHDQVTNRNETRLHIQYMFERFNMGVSVNIEPCWVWSDNSHFSKPIEKMFCSTDRYFGWRCREVVVLCQRYLPDFLCSRKLSHAPKLPTNI